MELKSQDRVRLTLFILLSSISCLSYLFFFCNHRGVNLGLWMNFTYYSWLILECMRKKLLLKSCVGGVEQMGYLIRMYVVFDLLGKFHFVSLSSYFNTNPIPAPSYQQTSRRW